MDHLEELCHAAAQVSEELMPGVASHDSELIRAVERMSEVYTLERSEMQGTQGDPSFLAARLRFFLPRDTPKLWPILDDLQARLTLPSSPTWRVLDLGSGLGTTSLGLAMHPSAQRVEGGLSITAVESDRACAPIHQALLKKLSDRVPPCELRSVLTSLPRLPSLLRRERFDFILVGLCLNELGLTTEGAADWLTGLTKMLSEDGFLIVIEPALRTTTRALQEVRDALAEAAKVSIASPCMHSRACPMLAKPRDWCHAELPQELPASLRPIAKEAGLRDHRLTFSYLCLQGAEHHRVHTTGEYRLVSSLLGSKGKVEAVVCGEAGYLRLMRLDRHCSHANSALDDLVRGGPFITSAAPDERGRLRISSHDEVKSPLAVQG
jgi:SAM-dependent methyltransferase